MKVIRREKVTVWFQCRRCNLREPLEVGGLEVLTVECGCGNRQVISPAFHQSKSHGGGLVLPMGNPMDLSVEKENGNG